MSTWGVGLPHCPPQREDCRARVRRARQGDFRRPSGNQKARRSKKEFIKKSPRVRQALQTAANRREKARFPANPRRRAQPRRRSVAASAARARGQNQSIGLLWMTAWRMNTPASTPSGNVHGMPLAALRARASRAVEHRRIFRQSAEHTALVGVRNLDAREKELGAIQACTSHNEDTTARVAAVMASALAPSPRESACTCRSTRRLRSVNRTWRRHPRERRPQLSRGALLMELIAESGRLTALDLSK